MLKNFFIIVSGPTGVGKTDFVDALVRKLPYTIETINVDVGQLYEPLSIGTAKPDYKHTTYKQHFFDVIKEPRDFTVLEFRNRVLETMHAMWANNIVPLIVGGSGFYVNSLFFPPLDSDLESHASSQISQNKLPSNLHDAPLSELWQRLFELDPERARAIHPNDRYRIERALSLIYEGRKPSLLTPQFEPPGTCAFYFLSRERDELYARINERVDIMLTSGWIDEVKNLDASWKEFLLKKKLIGYPDIIAFIEHTQNLPPAEYKEKMEILAQQIKRKTRAYAKRQITFWRMLRKKLEENDPKGAYIKKISQLNLTILPLDLYIEQMGEELSGLLGPS